MFAASAVLCINETWALRMLPQPAPYLILMEESEIQMLDAEFDTSNFTD
jgi:hypothetical protein